MEPNTMMNNMMENMGYSSFSMTLFWLSQLLILVLFFVVIWWVIKKSGSFSSSDSAEDILKKRLAKGEISQEQYNKLKKEIE